jgi:AraC-like DNA-binding protein
MFMAAVVERFSWPVSCSGLEDLVRLRRARDLMDRDYAKPLDVPALARRPHVAGPFLPQLSRSLRRDAVQLPDDAPDRASQGDAAAGDLTVTEVCFAVGCASLGSFSSRFTELVGESPSSYRAAAMTMAPPSRPASPRSTRDRSGTEKPTPPPAHSMQETNNKRLDNQLLHDGSREPGRPVNRG